jgi:hypothetical protein
VPNPSPDVTELPALRGQWPAYFRAHEAAWGAVLAPKELPPHPAPGVIGQWDRAEALTFPLPDAVLKLAQFAKEHGWEHRARYARGHGIHATTGRATAERHSIAIAFAAPQITQRQAVAVHQKPVNGGSWTWGSVWVMGPDIAPFGAFGLTELKAFLASPEMPADVLKTWCADIRTKLEVRAVCVKQRAKEKRESQGTGGGARKEHGG